TLLVEEWQGRGSISLKHFYLRRGLRLLPAFLALLLICLACTFFAENAAEAAAGRKEVWVAGCYVSNWPELPRPSLPTFAHTWSLSVEEQFYLLWPVLIYGMLQLKMSRRWILFVVSAGIVASASLRILLYKLHCLPGPHRTATIMRLYMGLDTRADALLVGCLLVLLATC